MRVIGLLMLLLGAASVHADDTTTGFMDGHFVWGTCNDARRQQLCMGIVMGLADGLGHLPNGLNWKCVPEGVTTRQFREVLEHYLRENRVLRDYSAAALAYVAFTEAWPCSAQIQ